MKALIFSIVLILTMTTIARAQDAKAHLRDFSSSYIVDTFTVKGSAANVKRRVILFQKTKGIKSAYWDDGTSILTVQYNNKLVRKSAIKNFFFLSQPFVLTGQVQSMER